jgi:aspartyl-tRNA(Asn)/glutamyl-tRNA(Gln) amidotransferase subunit B
VVWVLVTVATVAVVIQWRERGGDTRLYILTAWGLIVAWLIGYSELRIGRKQLRRGRDAMFLGLAAFVGEERTDHRGERTRGWTGTSPGALVFEPQGIRWVPSMRDEDPPETSFAWPDVYSWRLTGVIPFIRRASGYILLVLYDGRELVFHIHGVQTWRRAMRQAMIVGPTLGAPTPVEVGETPLPTAVPVVPAPAPAEAPAPVEQRYEPVIGLECHVELATASKMFCGCPATFGGEPNTHVCAVCSGQPGTLPVPNRVAIEHALRIALALNGTIVPRSVFHRKNYFYPDMPKNYQISQYDVPLATGGFLDIEVEGETRRIGIERVHIEEDTGKIVHAGEGGRIGVAEYALVDYNRAGIPLVEIVSKPDISSPDEARAYVAELRAVLLALGVSDVRMEEGSLRVDANVSIRPEASTELGVKVEVKNMNSIRSVQRALAYEIERQIALVKWNQPISQETRHFDENTGETIGGRSKEYSSDYRYFSDPDLVPLVPSEAWVAQIASTLPELPMQRRARLAAEYGLLPVDVRALTATPGLADAFESAVRSYGGPGQSIARWYLGELAQIANERSVEPNEVGVSPEHVAELQRLVDDGKVTISLAKGEVLRRVVETGRAPAVVVEEAGLAAISDEGELATIVENVIAAHPDVVEQIRGGKAGAVNFLKGQVMKETRGQADPEIVGKLLDQRLAPA